MFEPPKGFEHIVTLSFFAFHTSTCGGSFPFVSFLRPELTVGEPPTADLLHALHTTIYVATKRLNNHHE